MDPSLGQVFRKKILLSSPKTSVSFSEVIPVSDAGVYHVLLSKCDATEDSVNLFGDVKFSNFYGLLPAHMIGFLPVLSRVCSFILTLM